MSFFRVCTEVSSIRNTYFPSSHKLATKLITIDGITAAFLQTFANYRTDELMPPCLICLSDLSVCVYFCQPCKSARDNLKNVFSCRAPFENKRTIEGKEINAYIPPSFKLKLRLRGVAQWSHVYFHVLSLTMGTIVSIDINTQKSIDYVETDSAEGSIIPYIAWFCATASLFSTTSPDHVNKVSAIHSIFTGVNRIWSRIPWNHRSSLLILSRDRLGS